MFELIQSYWTWQLPTTPNKKYDIQLMPFNLILLDLSSKMLKILTWLTGNIYNEHKLQ